MDRVTKSYIDDFMNSNEMKSKGAELDFEFFCNYSIVKNYYSGTFDVDSVSTGKDAQGIDGIAVIVNGKLVTTVDEVHDLAELNKYIEAKLIFVQAKTSKSFQGTDIGNVLFSVKDFMKEKSSILTTTEITEQHDIVQALFDYFPIMTKGKPDLKIYFSSLGSWVGDDSQNAVVSNGEDELRALNYFESVEFVPVEPGELHRMYHKTKEKSIADFIFKDKVTLPDIDGVNEAYYGILPYSEFKNIVMDENENIKNIFYDNVRDYLGGNSVNSSIQQTLEKEKFDLFTVLNNGITLVASELVSSGNKFTIKDYQIVNGCQTSHVLFENKTLEGIENLNVPIRLIYTENEEVKNDITIATNNQTAVKPEQLEALSRYQKQLEEYYSTFDEDDRLFYERRTNQYSSDNTVVKTKVISIPIQIKAFSSMFLDLPHVVSGYYGTIMNNHGDKIFLREHKHIIYYTSSLIYYKLDSMFRQNVIDTKYKKARYHLIMLYRIFSSSDKMPYFNSNMIEAYCKNIIAISNSDEESLKLFNKGIEYIDKVMDVSEKSDFKSGEKTRQLLGEIYNE